MDTVTFAKAIADETRQAIMHHLCCCWLSVGEIVDLMAVSQPTVSHHLGILRGAGLVDVRREGRQVYYTLNQEMVTVCCGLLVNTFAPEQTLIDRDDVKVAAARA